MEIEENAMFCSICLGPASWPKARPKICNHIFCYLCINTWVKKRSECPLCKRPATVLVVVSQEGKEYKISVKEKTAVQYQNEIDEEHINLFQETEDITVAYARCQVCNLSKNEHLLLLCDGIIGQNIDGSSIRCNAACALFHQYCTASFKFNSVQRILHFITLKDESFFNYEIYYCSCHCYCLPEKLENVPEGEWFCPFCVDMRATQELVFNNQCIRRRYRSSSNYQQFTDFRESRIMNEDEPGPSRMNQSFRLSGYMDVFHSDEFLTKSNLCSVENSVSDNGMESDLDFLFNADSSKDDADWNNQDDMVLATDSDTGYDPTGMTEVRQYRWYERRRKVKKNFKKARKIKGMQKENVKHYNRSRNIRGKNRQRKNIKKKKIVTKAQKRLAEAIVLHPLTAQQKRQKKNERHFLPSYIRRKPLGIPMLSIRNGDGLDIPVETLNLQSTKYLSNKMSDDKLVEETDLITSIMFEQAKTLAPARYQHVLRNGTSGKTKQMIKQRKKLIDEKVVACKQLVFSEGLKDSNENVSMYSTSSSHNEAKEKRKRRPSRWGTPTTSKSHDTIITASIPLPLGPPLTHSAVSLENIPVPSTDQQPPQSQVALLSRPSALNTTPSTSLLKSAAIPSFGMASGQPPISLAPFAGSGLDQQPLALSQQSLVTLGQQQLTGLGQQTLASLGQQTLASLGQQSVPGLNQSQLTSIGQGSLVQMQPSLLSNFFLPPLNLGAMNGLLAAGLLANNNPLAASPITQSLAQSSSVTTAPFVLNQMQLSAASAQQLNQHFVNLATTLRRNVDMAADSSPQQTLKQPEGVPPPPPLIKSSESISSNISLCEPLAEKIRKLIEASNVRPLCDSSFEDSTTEIGVTVDDDIKNVVLCDDSKAGESGRKSASADDEETGEAVKIKKFHKGGAMFEEARRMLSSSLKKIYRLKQITKQEYKEIMKKGVTALSQRTKLDQRKVDEYAAKYVECVVHRRKKRY